jgi:hypothetical protein
MILTTSRLPESAASLFRTLNKAYPEIHISNPYPVTERKGESGWCNVTETVTLRSGDVIWRYGTLVPKERDCGTSIVCMCVFITAVPITKLLAWGEGDSGGHVLRETTSRGLCGLVCPSHTSECGGEGDCVKEGGGEEGERERERAGRVRLRHSPQY